MATTPHMTEQQFLVGNRHLPTYESCTTFLVSNKEDSPFFPLLILTGTYFTMSPCDLKYLPAKLGPLPTGTHCLIIQISRVLNLGSTRLPSGSLRIKPFAAVLQEKKIHRKSHRRKKLHATGPQV